MMQSILSLIHETLTSKESEDASSSETPKSGKRGEFESILTREDAPSMRCSSATRIKARATSTGDMSMNDDESDEDDATTCVNVDDFAAWAITHTIAAPPPSMKNPSISMAAVKLPSSATLRAANSDFRNIRNINTTYASPAPMPLPLTDRAGETIPAAALAPPTQEMAAVKDDAPNSKSITREIPIPTAAPRTQEMAATQTSAYIEKMARSANATDIPPPSNIPMVSGAPPANAAAMKPEPTTNANHSPAMATHPNSGSNNNSNTDSNNAKSGNGKSNDSKNAYTPNRFVTNAPVMSEAAFRPTVAVSVTDPRNVLSATPASVLATLDLNQTSDARQAAADRAVNQLTLSRAADGELDIPELGRVRVNAQMTNGEVDVRITADRQETQELVESHTHEIVIDAKSAAIPIVDLRVKLDPRAEPQTNFSSSQDSSKRRDPRAETDDSSKKQANHARIVSRARIVL